MNTKSKYKELISKYIAPFLKAQGFQKGSLSFYYIHNEILLRALAFEADRFNLPNQYSFRIFLHIVGLTNELNKVKDLTGIVQQGNLPIMSLSLNEFAQDSPGTYTITETANLPDLASEIIDHLKAAALPLLQDTTSVSGLQHVLAVIEEQLGYAKFSYTMAIFLAVAGDKEQSRQYFLKSKGDREVIVKTAAAYGIDLASDETTG